MWCLCWDVYTLQFLASRASTIRADSNSSNIKLKQGKKKQKNSALTAVCTSNWAISKLVNKHGTAPITTVINPMSPKSPLTICCLYMLHINIHVCPAWRNGSRLHFTLIKHFQNDAALLYHFSFVPKISLLVLSMLPSLQTASSNCAIFFPWITPLIFKHQRLLCQTAKTRGPESNT